MIGRLASLNKPEKEIGRVVAYNIDPTGILFLCLESGSANTGGFFVGQSPAVFVRGVLHVHAKQVFIVRNELSSRTSC